MAWAWVRPKDPAVLDGRPLLDLGTGDGQTLIALAGGAGLVVGADRSLDALRAAHMTGLRRLVCAEAVPLPFPDTTFATVLAADLFHHLDDHRLEAVIGEIGRVLEGRGRMVAWWYERPARPGPDAPVYPRPFDAVATIARRCALEPRPVDLESRVETPPTVGMVATR
jgi:SAM-dependent methyltransferase